MRFTVKEIYGDKPISPWIAARLTDDVRIKYGLKIQVTVNSSEVWKPALSCNMHEREEQ